MSNLYWRWKNPACNGKNVEWEEMNGKDFFAFLNSDQSNGRYFIKLDNDICSEDDVVFIEATKEQFEEWFREFNHHCYLRKNEPKEKPVSLDSTFLGEACISLHEVVADPDCVDAEDFAIHSALLRLLPVALDSLSPKLRKTLILKYYKYPTKTDEEIANIIGTNMEAFKKNRLRALNELKNFFEN